MALEALETSVPLPGNVNTCDDGYGGVEKTAAEPAAVAQQPATPTAATMAQPVGVGMAVSMPTTAVIAATPVVPIVPVSMVQVDLNYADAHSTMLPIIQGQERVHFYDRMHSGMRFALGFCSTTCCCWHMAEPRSYWKISENKVEFNYPVPCWPFCCMESCVMDVVGRHEVLRQEFQVHACEQMFVRALLPLHPVLRRGGWLCAR